MNWWKELKGKIKFKEPLKKHTAFKIGGACRYFIEPKGREDLKLLLNALKRYNISFLVIGAGSNILAADKGFKGAVIRLASPDFKKISFKGNFAEVGAGCLLAQLIVTARNNGFSGQEFLTGIPGTVGGALIMNAGAGKEHKGFGDLVENVTVMDYNGSIKAMAKKGLKFGYRSSNLSKYIILSTRIKLIKKSKLEIQNKIKGYLRCRKKTQDANWASAGCVFKNPPGISAGSLIDLCGLKGKKIGGACISDRHANFIINQAKAKASDVLKLIALAKRKVKDKFNIDLEPEIKIWA